MQLISTYLSSTFGELELHLSLLSRIPSSNIITVQAPVVWRVENAIHQINHYPVDSAIGFANTSLVKILKGSLKIFKDLQRPDKDL